MESIGAINAAILLGAVLILAGVASSLLASRFGAPLLLVVLGIGMLAGEDGPGGIVFNDYQATYVVGSIALAIILFDGGLRTRLARVRGALAPAAALATAGVLITAGLTGAVAKYALGLGWLEALLVGAIVSSTDAAAVFFLMRQGGLQLRRKVNATLEIESGTNDPVAVFLVILLVELILAGGHPTWEIGTLLAKQALIGASVGLAGGFAVLWTLNRIDFPAGLHPLVVVVSAVSIYALAAVFDGSGFLAVYLAGIVLANQPARAYASILSFHDAVTWLCQIAMFLVLGLLVTPTTLMQYALPALGIAAFLIVLGRPIAVWVCLAPFGFTDREKAFVSWVGLRGAVSVFLAAIPTLSTVPNAAVYFNVAFFVVLVSLLVQGWTLRWVAQRTGVARADAAPDVKRVEIDLPGQLDRELVGYPVHANSAVMARGLPDSWAPLMLVAREGGVVTRDRIDALKPGDYAYFLVEPRRIPRLDRLMSGDAGRERPAMALFMLDGDAELSSLESLYGLAHDVSSGAATVAQLFDERFGEGVREGDRIALGAATLVAREIAEDRVTSASLELDDTEDAALSLPRMRVLAERTLKRLARRS